MASVGEFVSDVTPREREALDAALRPGECVRWAVRPLRWHGVSDAVGLVCVELVAATLWGPSLAFLVMSAADSERIYSSAFLSWGTLMYVLPIVLFLLVPGVLLAVWPLLRWRRRNSTVYVLTNHRALVSAPAHFSGWTLQSFPLHEHMLRARICRPGGSGDLVFAAGATGGFAYVPNLSAAHRELNAALQAQMDAAERHLGNRAQNS